MRGVAGDAEATRRRLLEAALAEFSARGVAGARVDRIAQAASANKAQIYHYFESKEGLFRALMREVVEQSVAATPFDPLDLPEYAGRLFDAAEAHPEAARVVAWYRLENRSALEPGLRQAKKRIEAIAEAQSKGLLPTRFPAPELLALIVQITTTWSTLGPEFDGAARARSHEERRATVVAAVAALLDEPGPARC